MQKRQEAEGKIPTLIKKHIKKLKSREILRSRTRKSELFKQKRDNYHFQFCYGI